MKLPAPTSATEAAIDALAVARLTRLVQEDDVWPIRELRNLWLDRFGNSRLVDLATCPWCASVWIAALVVALRIKYPRSWPWIARALASSSVAGHLAHLAE